MLNRSDKKKMAAWLKSEIRRHEEEAGHLRAVLSQLLPESQKGKAISATSTAIVKGPPEESAPSRSTGLPASILSDPPRGAGDHLEIVIDSILRSTYPSDLSAKEIHEVVEKWEPKPSSVINLENTKKTLQRKKTTYGWEKVGGGRWSRWRGAQPGG